ncbi:MAG: hypothetical protein AAGA17_19225 [Actinomycetota bacterium]
MTTTPDPAAPDLGSLRGAALDDLVGSLDDAALDHLVAALTDEQRRRAVEAGDVEAVADRAFEELFDAKGAAGEPRVEGRLLVCPGSVVPKSKTVHLSRFVAVGETWVWDTIDLLHDEVRRGEGPAMRSVSIVPLVEGLEFHVVWSKGPSGGRRLERATSYRVRGGDPEPVSTRVPKLVANR